MTAKHSHLFLTAQSRDEVTAALKDARDRHALVACWVTLDPHRISWVAYLTELGDVARLTYYPDEEVPHAA